MPVAHISLTVSHLPTSCSFFLSCLQPLGYKYIGQDGNSIGFGVTDPDFFIIQETPGTPAGAAHVAFPAPSKSAVEQFFYAALKAGGTIHGEPKMRDTSPEYYSAAVIDLDGNSIEAVWKPTQNSSSRTSAPSLVGSTMRTELPVQVPESARSTISAAKMNSGRNTNSVARDLLNEAKSAVNVARSVAETAVPGAVTVPAPSSSSVPKDDSAKTFMGTLLGAAAGAFVAYQMTKSENSSPPAHLQRSSTFPPPASQYQSTGRPQPQVQQLALEAPRSTYSRAMNPDYSVEEESIYIPAASVTNHSRPSTKVYSTYTTAKSNVPSQSGSRSGNGQKAIEYNPPTASTLIGSFVPPSEVPVYQATTTSHSHAPSQVRSKTSSTHVSEVTIRQMSRTTSSSAVPSRAASQQPSQAPTKTPSKPPSKAPSSHLPSNAPSKTPSKSPINVPPSTAPSKSPSKASSKAPSAAPSRTPSKVPLPEPPAYEGSLLELGSVAPQDSISQVSSNRSTSAAARTLSKIDNNNNNNMNDPTPVVTPDDSISQAGSAVTVKPAAAKSSTGSRSGSRESKVGSKAGSTAAHSTTHTSHSHHSSRHNRHHNHYHQDGSSRSGSGSRSRSRSGSRERSASKVGSKAGSKAASKAGSKVSGVESVLMGLGIK